MYDNDDLQPDLQPVIDQLRANRPEATALELDAVKQRVLTRAANPARRRTRRTQLMKSRLVILSTLVLGILLSTAGAGLAIQGLSGKNASNAVYGAATPSASPGGGDVLGDEDTGAGEQPADTGGDTSPGGDEGNGVQPSRQVQAGADDDNLPFTGFAAIPVLLGGVALLSAGLVLRRRAGGER